MGIALTRMDSQAQQPNYVKTAATGLMAGAALKLSTENLPKAADTFKKAFKSSVDNQQFVLDHFKSKGVSVADYVATQKANLQKLSTPKKIHDTYAGYISNPQKAAALKNYESYYQDMMKTGTDKALKGIEATEKMLTKGKPSKLIATHNGVKATGGKLAEKAAKFKDTIAKFVKSKNKKMYLKENKEKIMTTLKKYGKPALIGAAILTGAALIKNAISEQKSEKTK